MATRKRNKVVAPGGSTVSPDKGGPEAAEASSSAVGAVEAAEAVTSADAPSREELIRREAYAIYERRGFAPGNETADWVEAEREVDRQLTSAG